MATRTSAYVLVVVGELDRASTLLEESAACAARANEPVHEAIARSNLGEVAVVRKDFQQAEAVLGRVLAIARTHGPPSLMFTTIGSLASVMLRTARLDEAAVLLREAGALLAPLGDQSVYTASFLVTCACLHAKRADHELAARLLARSEALCEDTGVEIDLNESGLREEALTITRAALDPATIADATDRGRALTIQAAIAQATGQPANHPR